MDYKFYTVIFIALICLYLIYLKFIKCKHDWEVVTGTKYADCVMYLVRCKKCGKIKTVRV